MSIPRLLLLIFAQWAWGAMPPIAQARDIHAVTAPGPGQAGYVHYFLLTHPNGELEYHVGIELEDQRVAWSFPGLGVSVSDFIQQGEIMVQGQAFKVEHLHGLRPFAREAEMRALRNALPQRVARWVDDETPYCVFRQAGERFCLNCGDFAVRLLFPGTHPLTTSLPTGFSRAPGANSTDDLLLYLLGLSSLRSKPEMLSRLKGQRLPDSLREDAIAMIEELHPGAAPPIAPASQRVAQRRAQARKL